MKVRWDPQDNKRFRAFEPIKQATGYFKEHWIDPGDTDKETQHALFRIEITSIPLAENRKFYNNNATTDMNFPPTNSIPSDPRPKPSTKPSEQAKEAATEQEAQAKRLIDAAMKKQKEKEDARIEDEKKNAAILRAAIKEQHEEDRRNNSRQQTPPYHVPAPYDFTQFRNVPRDSLRSDQFPEFLRDAM